jgi:hypothetical protein
MHAHLPQWLQPASASAYSGGANSRVTHPMEKEKQMDTATAPVATIEEMKALAQQAGELLLLRIRESGSTPLLISRDEFMWGITVKRVSPEVNKKDTEQR